MADKDRVDIIGSTALMYPDLCVLQGQLTGIGLYAVLGSKAQVAVFDHNTAYISGIFLAVDIDVLLTDILRDQTVNFHMASIRTAHHTDSTALGVLHSQILAVDPAVILHDNAVIGLRAQNSGILQGDRTLKLYFHTVGSGDAKLGIREHQVCGMGCQHRLIGDVFGTHIGKIRSARLGLDGYRHTGDLHTFAGNMAGSLVDPDTGTVGIGCMACDLHVFQVYITALGQNAVAILGQGNGNGNILQCQLCTVFALGTVARGIADTAAVYRDITGSRGRNTGRLRLLDHKIGNGSIALTDPHAVCAGIVHR